MTEQEYPEGQGEHIEPAYRIHPSFLLTMLFLIALVLLFLR